VTLDQAILREQFESLLASERQALDACQKLLSRLSDPSSRKQIEQLMRDKQKHIGLIERLLEIVE
jgi:ferritin-like metal-binding protein YciE